MTDVEIAEFLGFEGLSDEVRHRYPVGGPFSICAEQRRGIKGFRVTDMRSGRHIRVPTKREATRVAKLIEKDCYQK